MADEFAAPAGFILDLAHIDATMLPRVGGKAANLGELIHAGFRVPAGWCLTTDAYRRAVRPAGLDEVLAGIRSAQPTDLASLARLADRARTLILRVDIPEDIARAARAAYDSLGVDVPVAVRSSATAEDLPFASFAGQQDTYLNVIGGDAVTDAIRRCWASLWTDRAVAYRAQNGVSHDDVALAVVVQRMVDASVAGVLFTANPVTGHRREAIIDASEGLGESVVSGLVSPDHFVVDSESGVIRERRLGARRTVIHAAPDGGTVRVDRSTDATEACLGDTQVRTLAALGRRVERHYGAPQDLEWAIDTADTPWLTQARPITTLYPRAPRGGARHGTRAYLCFSLAQGLTRPITPMGLAGFRAIGSSVASGAGFAVADPLAGPTPYTEIGQRLFVDVTGVIRSRAGRDIASRVLGVMEARSAAVLDGLVHDPRFSVTARSRLPVVGRVARIARRVGAPPAILETVFRPDAALRRAFRVGQRVSGVVSVPREATPEQRLDHAERILGSIFPLVPSVVPVAAGGFLMLALAGRVLGDALKPGELQGVLRGLPHNVTTEMDLALWAVATTIRADAVASRQFGDLSAPELAEAYARGDMAPPSRIAVRTFLEKYGDRAVAEIDLGMPRWRDDPTHILGVLTNYLRMTDPGQAPDRQFAEAARQAEALVDKLVSRARERSVVRGLVVRGALRRARMLCGLRELPKYYIVVALAAVRRELLGVGTALAADGRIDAPDDIFFVDLVEARDGLEGRDLRRLIAERRETYDRELRRRHVPRVVLSDGTEPESAMAASPLAGPDTLIGSAASAGTVTGAARVILDPVGARLEPGEVLIAPSTDPGWTALFLTAGALVMEMGGSNSHGAVVAREYGIPAVVGVSDATRRIETGRLVTVDGAAGTITLH